MKYYCIDQFKTLHIRSTNTGSVLVSPCCASITSPVDPTTFQFDTDPFLSRIRQNTINDIPASECHRCWKEEALSQTSRRQFGNQSIKTKTFDIIPEMRRLDVTTQNICNLACVQCSAYSSSTWAKEDGITNQDYSYSDKIKLFQRLPHHLLKWIHFTGGEPLMTTEHKKMLESYAENADLSQLKVSYNTNGTFFPDDEVLDLWKKTQHVNLVISTDAIGPAAEILRWPCQWDQLDNNIQKFISLMKSLPTYQINVSFIVCVQNLNILELEDLYLYCLEQHPGMTMTLQIVDSISRGDILHPAAITDEVFEEAKNMLGKYDFFKTFLNNIEHHRQTSFSNRNHYAALEWLDSLEEKRKTQWRNALRISKFSQDQ